MDISAEVAAIQAASQGSELRQPLVGALNKLNSGSLPAVTASDVGKILKVGANGWEVGEKSGYIPAPTGTKQITENGTEDVTQYASVVVNVPNSFTAGDEGKVVSNGALVSQGSQSIDQNGTYDTTLKNEVIVNVSGGGGGGSGAERLTAIATDTSNGYNSNVAAGGSMTFNYNSNNNYKNDVYRVYSGHVYMLRLGAAVGNRFRCNFTQVNTAEATSSVYGGTSIGSTDSPTANYINGYALVAPSDGYITITKSANGTAGIPTYVFDVTNCIAI